MTKEDIPDTITSIDGLWVKDEAASDSMEPAFDLIQMSVFVRKAMILVRGIRLEFLDGHFLMHVTSWIPGFKVTEKYPLNGSEVKLKRRDWRAGYHTGYIHGTGKDNELQLDYSWTDPLAGSGRDIVQFVDSGRLIVHHRVAVGNTSVSYKDVYVRAPRSPMK